MTDAVISIKIKEDREEARKKHTQDEFHKRLKSMSMDQLSNIDFSFSERWMECSYEEFSRLLNSVITKYEFLGKSSWKMKNRLHLIQSNGILTVISTFPFGDDCQVHLQMINRKTYTPKIRTNACLFTIPTSEFTKEELKRYSYCP